MKPITLTAPEVLATLDGVKTHLCRPVTVPWKGNRRALPYEPYYCDSDGVLMFCNEYGNWKPWIDLVAPFGRVGSRLYGRETWAPVPVAGGFGDAEDADETQALLIYRANGEQPLLRTWLNGRPRWNGKWRSSATMPQWASRITLEVTALSVFRVQDITEELARREGLPKEIDNSLVRGTVWWRGPRGEMRPTAKDAFRLWWIDAHGPESWSRNDWVWGVGYKLLNTKDTK